MKPNITTTLLVLSILFFGSFRLSAQSSREYSLRQLVEAAKKNNRMLTIKDYQVQEKMSKLKEDEIKRYPTATLDGSYQYNFTLPDFVIPAGTLGSVPTGNGTTQPLPATDSKFRVGEKGMYAVGFGIYQPLTQQFKINTGLAIDKTDIQLGQKEKEKATLQVELAIEQLYYAAMITQKQTESAGAKLEMTKAKLQDAEGTLAAGKTTVANISGLRAGVAYEKQHILKLSMQLQDYLSDLSELTNLDAGTLKLSEIEPDSTALQPVDVYKRAAEKNPEIAIARLNREKASLGIKAASESNLPDLGIIAGYNLQHGNPILPGSSPYVGLSLRWNLQDLFSNRQVKNQRMFQLKQAEESVSCVRQQVTSGIDKAWRKVKQSDVLIETAKKLVSYRSDALKEEQDKQVAGMDIKTTLLARKSELAEAEAELYTAKLSNLLALAELRNLTGGK